MEQILFLIYEFLSAFLPFFLIYMIRRVRIKQKRDDLILMIFLTYVVAVFHVTGAGTLYDGMSYRWEIRPDQLNFSPFSNEIDVAAYLLNVLLFVPWGLLVPLCWREGNCADVLGSSLFFTVLLEVSQLLNNRRTDIDDLILNVLGAFVGYLLYQLLARFTNIKRHEYNLMELLVCVFVLFAGRFFLFHEMVLAKLIYGF